MQQLGAFNQKHKHRVKLLFIKKKKQESEHSQYKVNKNVCYSGGTGLTAALASALASRSCADRPEFSKSS